VPGLRLRASGWELQRAPPGGRLTPQLVERGSRVDGRGRPATLVA